MFKSAFYLAVIAGLILQADAQSQVKDLQICAPRQPCEISVPLDQNHMEYHAETQCICPTGIPCVLYTFDPDKFIYRCYNVPVVKSSTVPPKDAGRMEPLGPIPPHTMVPASHHVNPVPQHHTEPPVPQQYIIHGYGR